MKTREKAWWTDGFGLQVVIALNKRDKRAYNGLFHLGGIHTGTWITTPDADGARVRKILSLYDTEDEFLDAD